MRRNEPVKLVLDREAYRRLAALHGVESDEHAAAVLGVTRSQVTRVRNGTLLAGNKFLAGVSRAWGAAAVSELFLAVPDPAPHRAKAGAA